MTPDAGALFLIACLALLFGLLVLAAVIEGITAQLQHGSPTGPAPSADCGCSACRGLADVPRPRG